MNKDHKLIRLLSDLLHLALNFFSLLYLIRFQLIILLFIVLFRVMIFNWHIGKPLLEGLFDLPTFCNVFWFSFFSYMLAWSAITLMKVTLVYAGRRFQVGRRIDLSFTKNKLFNQIVFLTGCLAPLVLFTGIFWLKDGWWKQFLGLAVGAVTAFVVLIVVDLIQLTLSDFSENRTLDAGDTLFPFPNPLYRKAARYKPRAKVFNLDLIGRLERLIALFPAKYGEGYIVRTGDRVEILPGHIFSALLFLTFLLIYTGGFIFWYYSSMPDKSALIDLNLEVTSISYVLILLTLLCTLFSGFAFFFDRYRIPTLMVVAFILYLANDQHHFDVRPQTGFTELTPAEVIKNKKDHPYIIVVATNGGGIQAAAWTTKVLSELVNECKKLDTSDKGCENAITMISSVSGGSVGSMFFVNSYNNGHIDKKDLEGTVSEEDKLGENRIVDLAESSSLDYVAGGLVYADFVRSIKGFDYLGFQDRGNALERSWLENLKKNDGGNTAAINSLNGYLGSWREDARHGDRPAVIFNSTVAETGDRFIFPTSDTAKPGDDKSSPCKMDRENFGGVERNSKILFSGWDSFYGITKKNRDVKITSAVRLSASFGFVSPAANIKDPARDTGESLHFVDGGYNENYGVASLLDWLDEGLCNSSKEETPRILLVQIVADKVFERDPCSTENRNCDFGNSWYAQALAPASTLWNIRSSVQLERNESELKLFLRYWRQQGFQINKVVFEYNPGTDKENELAPLSWHLTPEQKANIKNVWKTTCRTEGKNREPFEQFRLFIRGDAPPVVPCDKDKEETAQLVSWAAKVRKEAGRSAE